MGRVLTVGVTVMLGCAMAWGANAPERAGGLSAHALPKRVAALDPSGRVKWGYTIRLPGTQVPQADRPVVQSAAALVEFLKKQPATVQANGIWVVTTSPAAYSPEEAKDLEELKRLCKAAGIPLFICRGSELPDGWQRFSLLAREPDSRASA
jgi:hypothetical protein